MVQTCRVQTCRAQTRVQAMTPIRIPYGLLMDLQALCGHNFPSTAWSMVTKLFTLKLKFEWRLLLSSTFEERAYMNIGTQRPKCEWTLCLSSPHLENLGHACRNLEFFVSKPNCEWTLNVSKDNCMPHVMQPGGSSLGLRLKLPTN